MDVGGSSRTCDELEGNSAKTQNPVRSNDQRYLTQCPDQSPESGVSAKNRKLLTVVRTEGFTTGSLRLLIMIPLLQLRE